VLPAYLEDGARRIQAAARAIAGCAVPVVGVVNGAAFGGALELAMACDWRIARRGARLGMPAARLGVVYAPDGLRRFVAALGPGRTRRLFLTGEPVDAGEALAIGLVDQVVEPDELWPAAHAAAAGVAAAAPLAVAGTRALVRALSEGPLPPEVDRAAGDWVARAFASDDFREGLAAFRERRAPHFRGR
jgi:enoyl-CoA hydratase/carnithine racemase